MVVRIHNVPEVVKSSRPTQSKAVKFTMMKTESLVVLVALLSSGMADWRDWDIKFAYSERDLPPANETKLLYYPRSSPAISSEEFTEDSFDKTKNIVVLVHGMGDSHLGPCQQEIAKAIHKMHGNDTEVFMIDYHEQSKYYTACYKQAAQRAAELLMAAHVPTEKMHCTGMSLGAHVCGCLQRTLGHKMHRATGLDPAGPFFGTMPENEKLSPYSAHYVEAVHTNAGRLGYNGNLGHHDTWVNGGNNINGCDNDDSCKHATACKIYVESIYEGSRPVTTADGSSSFWGYDHALPVGETQMAYDREGYHPTHAT